MFGKTELFKCMWGLGRFTLSDNNCLVVMIILMDTRVLAYFPEEWRMARLEEFLRCEDPVFKTWRSEDCIFCCILPQLSADDLKSAAHLNSEESKYVCATSKLAILVLAPLDFHNHNIFIEKLKYLITCICYLRTQKVKIVKFSEDKYSLAYWVVIAGWHLWGSRPGCPSHNIVGAF